MKLPISKAETLSNTSSGWPGGHNPSSAHVFGFAPWKKFIVNWLPSRRIFIHSRKIPYVGFFFGFLPHLIIGREVEIYVWGFKQPIFLHAFCRVFKVKFIRVEDGFLRSIALGATETPPLSLCFDGSGTIYYDARKCSGLEEIIQNFDFGSHSELLERARMGIQQLMETRLSKYNYSKKGDIEKIYGPKTKKRIVVLGQVEGDMSIIRGCDKPITNNEFVRLVAAENSDAQIIYKPHPEVLHKTRRKKQSDPNDVRDVCTVLDQDIALADALETIDHAYTMTSLSGFEALLRRIPVTCYGMPFYAGWGVTEDMQYCSRRTAIRTVEEIFAAAYILYPKYFDYDLCREITFEEAINLLYRQKMKAAGTA